MTIKTQNGKVITKDGKVSCECCGCSNLGYNSLILEGCNLALAWVPSRCSWMVTSCWSGNFSEPPIVTSGLCGEYSTEAFPIAEVEPFFDSETGIQIGWELDWWSPAYFDFEEFYDILQCRSPVDPLRIFMFLEGDSPIGTYSGGGYTATITAL